MGRFGATEILVILLIAVVLFGGKKLAGLGKGLGEGIRGLKKGLSEINDPDPPELPAKATAAASSATEATAASKSAETDDDDADDKVKRAS